MQRHFRSYFLIHESEIDPFYFLRIVRDNSGKGHQDLALFVHIDFQIMNIYRLNFLRKFLLALYVAIIGNNFQARYIINKKGIF